MDARRWFFPLVLGSLLVLQLGCVSGLLGGGQPGDSEDTRCTSHRVSMTLASTCTELRVGESVTVTATLRNVGCAMVGLPKYTLSIDSEGASILEPDDPEPVEHHLPIRTGESDTGEFGLVAVSPGSASLTGAASFEVHLDYPGPAYWSSAGSSRLKITVKR